MVRRSCVMETAFRFSDQCGHGRDAHAGGATPRRFESRHESSRDQRDVWVRLGLLHAKKRGGRGRPPYTTLCEAGCWVS